MTAYYNEFDPFAAQTLRNLIAAGHIAPGFVDERSIEDVKPWELFGYTQCHFFAGVGVWSLALRRAGWPDDRHVWTASCPCQPFSSAGKGAGFNDERHLWPAFYHLVSQLEPTTLFGEQVASKDAEAWIDLVHADLEAMGYAFGCVPFPAAGVGAPNLRERAYWVAHSEELPQRPLNRKPGEGLRQQVEVRGCRFSNGVGDASGEGLEGLERGHSAPAGHRAAALRPVAEAGQPSGLGNTNSEPARRNAGAAHSEKVSDGEDSCDSDRFGDAGEILHAGQPAAGPVNGLWRDADWLYCRDGKWRPVEPGTFPLAYGAAARVGRLRAYGNALNAEAARIFIESVNEVIYETN